MTSSAKLKLYKLQQTDILKTKLKTDIAIIQSIYNQKVAEIRNLRISGKIKTQYIHYYKNQYYKNIYMIRVKFFEELNKINLLNSIPFQEIRTVSDKFALIVGINYLNTSNQLYGCINDANNINKFLNSHEYKNENIVLLTDDSNIKPTKENIINNLTKMLKNSIKGDTLFFSYSGHGTNTLDLNNDELDGRDEMIMPIDFTNTKSCIIDDELKTIIDSNLKQGVKLFMLVDSCFSGTICDLKYSYLNNTINNKSNETSGDVICISGCLDNQLSQEAAVINELTTSAVGAMTFAFLNTIETKGNNISINELIEVMRKLLADNMYVQVVQISSGKYIDISTTYVKEII